MRGALMLAIMLLNVMWARPSRATVILNADLNSTVSIIIEDAIIVSGDRLVKTTGTNRSIRFTNPGSVDGDGGNDDSLTFDSTNEVFVEGDVGTSDPLQDLDVTAAGNITFDSTVTVDNDLTVTNGEMVIFAGTAGVDGDLSISNVDEVIFKGIVYVGGNLTIAADVQVTFQNPVQVDGGLNIVAGTRVVFQNTLSVGNNTDITSNEIGFEGGSESVQGNGGLTLRPYDASLDIEIGAVTGSGSAGIMDLVQADLNALTDGFSTITIGDTGSGSGNVDIDTATFHDPLIIAGGVVHDQTGVDLSAPDITLMGAVSPGQSPGVLTINGDYSFFDNSDFVIEIGGTAPGTADSNHDQIDVTGTVTIGSNVTLSIFSWSGFAPQGGESLTIVSNDGLDAVVGTFDGLPEGGVLSDFLGSGLDAVISYSGENGDSAGCSCSLPGTCRSNCGLLALFLRL